MSATIRRIAESLRVFRYPKSFFVKVKKITVNCKDWPEIKQTNPDTLVLQPLSFEVRLQHLRNLHRSVGLLIVL